MWKTFTCETASEMGEHMWNCKFDVFFLNLRAEHQILCSNSASCSKYQSGAAGCLGNSTPLQNSKQRACQSRFSLSRFPFFSLSSFFYHALLLEVQPSSATLLTQVTGMGCWVWRWLRGPRGQGIRLSCSSRPEADWFKCTEWKHGNLASIYFPICGQACAQIGGFLCRNTYPFTLSLAMSPFGCWYKKCFCLWCSEPSATKTSWCCQVHHLSPLPYSLVCPAWLCQSAL